MELLKKSVGLVLAYIKTFYFFLAHKSIRLKLAISFSAFIALLILTLGTLLSRRFEFSLVSSRVNDDIRLANTLAEQVRLSLDKLSSDICFAVVEYGLYSESGDLSSKVDLLEKDLPEVHVLSLWKLGGQKLYGENPPEITEELVSRGLRLLRKDRNEIYFVSALSYANSQIGIYGSIDVYFLRRTLTLLTASVEEATAYIADRGSKFAIYQMEEVPFEGILAFTIDETNIDIREVIDKGIYRVYWPVSSYDLDAIIIRSLKPIFITVDFARKVTLLGAVLGGLLGLALAYAITHPLKKLIRGAKDVLSGRTDRLLEVKYQDEIGMIASVLNSTMNSLLEMKKYTDSILENISSGLMTVNSELEVTALNKAAVSILGVNSKEISRRRVREILGDSPGNREVSELIENSLRIGRGFREIREVEITNRSGGRIPIGLTISVISERRSKLKTAIVLFVDLSERKELEGRLMRADRLAALGRMAAGVAHEIRNPLGSIRGLTQLINEELDEKGDLKNYVETVLREVDRLNHVVEGVLELSTDVVPNKSQVDIRDVLDETLSLLSYNTETGKVSVETDYSKNLRKVYADPNQLKRAFLNIAINAFQSMPDGGKLVVKAGSSEDGKVLLIEFSDIGIGMKEEDVDKVFEPFYSTKDKGVGLGLSMSRKIVLDHGGGIDIESQLDRGTTVRIRLPIGDNSAR